VSRVTAAVVAFVRFGIVALVVDFTRAAVDVALRVGIQARASQPPRVVRILKDWSRPAVTIQRDDSEET
jgi:hypothetical protein